MGDKVDFIGEEGDGKSILLKTIVYREKLQNREKKTSTKARLFLVRYHDFARVHDVVIILSKLRFSIHMGQKI